MLKIEVIARTPEDLDVLKPLLDAERTMLAPPANWPTRNLFEELQRRAAAVGKQVHLVDIEGAGHTATQTGTAPPHTETIPGGEAETTAQAAQHQEPKNKGFTKEAQTLWDKYAEFHEYAAGDVLGTSKAGKVTKADMERWLEANPHVVRAFAEARAPAEPGDQTTDATPPTPEGANGADTINQDTVVAWANVLMQAKGFDGLKAAFEKHGSSTGKLSGVPQERWPELVAHIQEQTGVAELPA